MHLNDCSSALEAKGSATLIKVAVSANAKQNQICDYDPWRRRLNVKIKAPPSEGRANKVLLEFFSELFGVSKSDVRIVSGEKSSLKVLHVNLASERVAEILRAHLK